MDADGKTDEVADEDEPAQGGSRVHAVFLVPFQNSPEHNGGKEGRHGIYLALYGAEPERVGKSISQAANDAGAQDGPLLWFCNIGYFLGKHLDAQAGNGPEQE